MAVGIGEALDQAWARMGTMFNIQSAPNPELFKLVLLLVVGFVGGRILSEVVLRLLRMTSLNEIGVKSDVQLVLRRLNYHGTLAQFIADTLRWAIYALTILAVFNLFGSDVITGYSETAMLWASKFLVAMFVLLMGALISERIGGIFVQVFRAGRISGRVDESHAEIPLYLLVGKLVKYVGFLITGIIALSFLGVDTAVIHIIIAVFGAMIAAALLLASWHLLPHIGISMYLQLSRMFRGGERVSVGDYSGKIVGIRPLYTKIKSDGRIYYVPNAKLVSDVVTYDGEGE